jgi:hypothetical protein
VRGIGSRQGAIGATNQESTLERGAIGPILLRGRALDIDGHPVSGAALMVDQLLVYTDDDGRFYLRERKPRTHQLKVLGDRFLTGGVYRIVSAPATTRSSAMQNEPETVVVVQRMTSTIP